MQKACQGEHGTATTLLPLQHLSHLGMRWPCGPQPQHMELGFPTIWSVRLVTRGPWAGSLCVHPLPSGPSTRPPLPPAAAAHPGPAAPLPAGGRRPSAAAAPPDGSCPARSPSGRPCPAQPRPLRPAALPVLPPAQGEPPSAPRRAAGWRRRPRRLRLRLRRQLLLKHAAKFHHAPPRPALLCLPVGPGPTATAVSASAGGPGCPPAGQELAGRAAPAPPPPRAAARKSERRQGTAGRSACRGFRRAICSNQKFSPCRCAPSPALRVSREKS